MCKFTEYRAKRDLMKSLQEELRGLEKDPELRSLGLKLALEELMSEHGASAEQVEDALASMSKGNDTTMQKRILAASGNSRADREAIKRRRDQILMAELRGGTAPRLDKVDLHQP